MSVAEGDLVARAQSGDLVAFEELVTLYEKKVYNLAYRMIGNRDDAADLAQEVFIKVFRSLGRFRSDSSFSTWLYRVARNTCLDQLRRRRPATVSLDEPLDTGEGVLPRQLEGGRGNPEKALERRELMDNLQALFATLPDEYRLALILRDLHGLSYEEISAVLECSLGTVKSRIHRARQEMKEKLLAMELFSAVGVQRRKGGSRSE